MSDLVKLTRDGAIGIITIDNPPVNALSPGVPEGISECMDALMADDSLKAAVMIGAGRTFVAGADIKEFGKITSGQSKRGVAFLPLLLKIEDCPKPVVMAIHGTAFGGGLELALAGHYRVAVPSAQVGQPEVKLGIIPGAGGTQRLPRLAGIAKALEMCVDGNPVKADEAEASGIVDEIIDGDLLAGALAVARQAIGFLELIDPLSAEKLRKLMRFPRVRDLLRITRLPLSNQASLKTRERTEKLGTERENAVLFAAARDNAAKKYRNRMAPQAAIDAIEAAARLPFEEGCQVEAKLFQECLFSDQSKGMIHAFFGEREVAKVPDIGKGTPVRPVNSVAVVGAGTMGGGITMIFANAGIPVLLKEADQAALDRGLSIIRKNYENSAKKGRFTLGEVERRIALIKPTLTYDGFDQADMIIEAVFEGMALKKQIFAEIDKVAKSGAILASNTSTLSIDEIASATSRPESVIGTHFFSPANVMRLLEIVRGAKSGKDVLNTCMQLSKKIGKVGVLVGNCRGFVGNRMFGPYRREAQFLVEEGASVEAVDKALYDWGMAMGPLATGDLAGLDVGWRIRKEFAHLEKPGVRQPIAEDRLCEMGRYGQKTGAGWYRYDVTRRAVPDREVALLVREWAKAAGIPQRAIAAEEIVDRCIYALVNEGARILEEGFALRSVDIDMVYVFGYGFPPYRGGPMFYADTVGLREVYGRIRGIEAQHGELWEPAPLLKRLAEEGKTFGQYTRETTASA
jgi:3-hydroxyacyl-CoA dehydrogenase